MLLRLYILLSLWIGLGELGLYAQAPGYLGRRTLLSTSADISPAIRIASRRDIPPFLFNVRLSFEAEQVLSRRFSAGFTVNPLLTGVRYDYQQIKGFTTIHGLGAGLSFRMYSFRNTGNIAPLGPYTKLEVFYLTYWLKDRGKDFYDDGRSWLGQYNDLGLSVMFGSQRIVGQQLTVHYGIRFATIFDTFDWNQNAEERYLKSIATDRIQGHFFMNIHVGVGLLLF